ncbi:hypothetical protein WA026_014349 [Henosepilachna vigintioctopunctata]|uniref:Uncharacterized protein n=1 Tax=Henosepilachna vigintioctopunctata TaxID=420089 RepID=A0AAW1UBJ9_9CUCU
MKLKENEKKHSASDNKDSVQKSVTNTHFPPTFSNESSTKISSKPESTNRQRSTEPVDTTIMPKNPHKVNIDSKGTTTISNNDFVINVSPTMESTSPIYNTKEQYREPSNRNEEEDKLQNLDILPILTSRSTSTSVSIDQDSSARKRNKIMLFSAENPATKSTPIMNFIENGLYTTPSIEIRTPLEDIPDFRQKKEEDNYLSDEISGEFNYSSTDNGSLVTHVSIAVFTTFILVMIMTLMVLVHYYTRRRRKRTSKITSEHHQNYSGGPTVSVYTHSIFHTPLPDPPTFENPVFASPTDNSLDHRTFQTHLVCSLKFPGHHPLEEKEYTYDHPPSTGSYRAASIPEPPDSNEAITAEPLYDEIPSNNKEINKTIQQPYKSSCIYVNTCGRTKF